MTVRRRLTTGLVSSLILCGIISAGSSSTEHRSGASGSTPVPPAMQLPLTVDGAVTPELISDDLAFHHFLMAIAVADNATPDSPAVLRRDTLLARAGLVGTDRQSVANATSGLREELDQIALQQQQIRSSTPNADAVALGLKTAQDTALRTARERVMAALGSDSMSRLNSHIRLHTKKHIRIYGHSPAAPAVH